ncbi:hypothetical protein VPH35_058759 [Triticum aestivum]
MPCSCGSSSSTPGTASRRSFPTPSSSLPSSFSSGPSPPRCLVSGCRAVLVFGLQGIGSDVIDSSTRKVMMADEQLQVHGSPGSPGDAGSNSCLRAFAQVN